MNQKKKKSYINIITKSSSRKHIIVSMSKDNILKFILKSNIYITNINRTLKNIKSNIIADFICIDHCKLIIITNWIVSPSNLSTIEKYIKNINNFVSEDIMFSYLPQSKSYLKS